CRYTLVYQLGTPIRLIVCAHRYLQSDPLVAIVVHRDVVNNRAKPLDFGGVHNICPQPGLLSVRMRPRQIPVECGGDNLRSPTWCALPYRVTPEAGGPHLEQHDGVGRESVVNLVRSEGRRGGAESDALWAATVRAIVHSLSVSITS